jgi:hypothetical protein
MLCDNRPLSGKQNSHVLLGQPYGLLFQTHIYGCPAVFCPVKDNLAAGSFDFCFISGGHLNSTPTGTSELV